MADSCSSTDSRSLPLRTSPSLYMCRLYPKGLKTTGGAASVGYIGALWPACSSSTQQSNTTASPPSPSDIRALHHINDGTHYSIISVTTKRMTLGMSRCFPTGGRWRKDPVEEGPPLGCSTPRTLAWRKRWGCNQVWGVCECFTLSVSLILRSGPLISLLT